MDSENRRSRFLMSCRSFYIRKLRASDDDKHMKDISISGNWKFNCVDLESVSMKHAGAMRRAAYVTSNMQSYGGANIDAFKRVDTKHRYLHVRYVRRKPGVRC